MSGATDYQSLCLAAKAEEKRLAEIKKRRQYHSEHKPKSTSSSKSDGSNSRSPNKSQSDGGSGRKNSTVRCWNCRRTGHMAADCKAPKREESDKPARREKPTNARQV